MLKNIREKFASNILMQRFIKIFSVDVLVRGSNFLLIFIFIRLMTKEAFGIYGYLYSFAMTASGILGFGLYTSISKLYVATAEELQKRKSMLFTITVSLLVLVFVSMIILTLTDTDAWFFSVINTSANISASTYRAYRIYVFVAIVSMIMTNYLSFYFIASEQIKNIQRFNLLRLFLSNGAAILMLWLLPLDGAMLRLAGTYVCELLLTVIFFRKVIRNMLPKFDVYYLKKALKVGFPVMLTAIVFAMMNFGDKYFVFRYTSSEKLAEYNLAFLLGNIVLLIYNSFNSVWLPIFFKEKDLLVLKKRTSVMALRIFLIFSALGVCIWIGSWFLFKIHLFTPAYYGMLRVLPMLTVAQMFSALVQLYTNYMLYFEKTWIQFLVGIVLSVVCYFSFDLAGRYFSSEGIAVVLMLSNILQFIFYFFIVEWLVKNYIRTHGTSLTE